MKEVVDRHQDVGCNATLQDLCEQTSRVPIAVRPLNELAERFESIARNILELERLGVLEVPLDDPTLKFDFRHLYLAPPPEQRVGDVSSIFIFGAPDLRDTEITFELLTKQQNLRSEGDIIAFEIKEAEMLSKISSEHLEQDLSIRNKYVDQYGPFRPLPTADSLSLEFKVSFQEGELTDVEFIANNGPPPGEVNPRWTAYKVSLTDGLVRCFTDKEDDETLPSPIIGKATALDVSVITEAATKLFSCIDLILER